MTEALAQQQRLLVINIHGRINRHCLSTMSERPFEKPSSGEINISGWSDYRFVTTDIFSLPRKIIEFRNVTARRLHEMLSKT